MRKLNPETIERAYFIGDRPEDVTCERAVREAYKEDKIETNGFYLSRTGKTLEGYPTIISLEGVLTILK
jgi:hypothetical protein